MRNPSIQTPSHPFFNLFIHLFLFGVMQQSSCFGWILTVSAQIPFQCCSLGLIIFLFVLIFFGTNVKIQIFSQILPIIFLTDWQGENMLVGKQSQSTIWWLISGYVFTIFAKPKILIIKVLLSTFVLVDYISLNRCNINFKSLSDPFSCSSWF